MNNTKFANYEKINEWYGGNESVKLGYSYPTHEKVLTAYHLMTTLTTDEVFLKREEK